MTKPITKILLIGKSGRLDAIADALFRSSRPKELYILSEVSNPGLASKAVTVFSGLRTDDCPTVERIARQVQPDFVVIEPEEPLAAGVVDMLRKLNISAVGPSASLARLETSKVFTRQLFDRYDIPGNIRYRQFNDEHGLENYMDDLGEFVIKPDGLTGGKGVKVKGDHFETIREGLLYCRELLKAGSALVIEEKLEGEEFSFQSFCDGDHLVDMVPVQDHKRAKEGDQGPNTGGMGSYSCEDHLLPFLTQAHVNAASIINKKVAEALFLETGEKYKGIIYGSFILTRNGLKVIEYNARFGDPEAMNVLPLLKADFIDVCEAIIEGRLNELDIKFERKATVCKYVVPSGYPSATAGCERIDLSKVVRSPSLRICYAAVKQGERDDLYLTGSRAVAFVGIAENLRGAEAIAERAASQVVGPVDHRSDIGTASLVRKRVEHMQALLGYGYLTARESRPRFQPQSATAEARSTA